ncbi:malate:quinone-oxidoreductase [Campylobacter blaseri]|uniref:malate dehydrogenase (quinone) n=1 Tax=Campylobacter blaseri TaxID=2042961 RepID=A0A2P8R0G3_9BACT|nr:FAD-dependent oxidoreductase [Campylobacter blaseri]PSM51978.1 malate:quinone oxidoreductase [Campylobacter blaseri]PSM53763.1 malate:quinone oxidoreductase [Campylobacter blaseri]QKF85683.1 malate:quinone-oxidoreductase [Campylobacter blaseri]
MQQEKHYEVIVIGGGITGAALLYELSRYTDIKKLALLEKYEAPGTLNTKATANSQTIHSGDIETNYTYEKASKVKQTADMVVKYNLQHGYEDKFMFRTQKMTMGVGDKEVWFIKERFESFKNIYPHLELFSKDDLKEIEPAVVYDEFGNERDEEIVAMGTRSATYTTIDYGAMAVSLIKNSQKEPNKVCDIFYNTEVLDIEKIGDRYYLKTKNKASISADFVIVNAGAHSLWLAHKMGYGKDLSCLAMAGSFYLSKKEFLKGKVYMVQNPKLPFAALHGDPDIKANGLTRFGPTALPILKLERYHGFKSFPEYLKTLNLDSNVMSVFWNLLKDRDIRKYFIKNVIFEMPFINVRSFVKDARKIIPSLKTSDIYFAKGFGGVRPQVINKKNRSLMLGEASINAGDGIIFNMTPSPGATSCLGNALKDVKIICEYLGKTFNENKFNEELIDDIS